LLIENTLFGVKDKVAIAIDRLRAFEPEEGYYLAFSGGKDSQTIYHLAKEAGVRFDAHYNLTTVDPPELVYFIRKNYPDVQVNYPQKSMWRLIEQKGLPTRWRRYCCSILKEGGGEGRICVTGVRWAESAKRKNNRSIAEILGNKKSEKILLNDNEADRRLFENCQIKGKRIINPIVDWLEEDVWEYLNSRQIEHCKLYDEGFTRLGCIGCPLAGTENMLQEFERWPKYYDSYFRAVERFIPHYLERCEKRGAKPFKKTAQEWMNWWINGPETIIDYDESFLDDEA
jgi:phosphoadenosine phosphosulfate reductase